MLALELEEGKVLLELRPEIVSWYQLHPTALALLRRLASDPGMRRHLANEGALRSLALLIYVRAMEIPPYRSRSLTGVSGEQLYRLERAIRREGLEDAYLSALSLLRLEAQRT